MQERTFGAGRFGANLQKGKRSKGRFRPAVYVFAVLMLFSFSVLLFSTRSFVLDFKDVGLSMFSGVRGSIHEAASLFSRTVLSIRELASLKKEYAGLLDKVAGYELLERNAAEIREENRRLREQLGFSQTIRYQKISAEIIGRDPDNLYSALVINKGRHSGVANNMAVIAWQDGYQALVGKVIQAGAFESFVMPIYDVNFFVSARLSASRFEGMVEGQGSPDAPLLMRFIPKRARDRISQGDTVVTSGLGGIYRPGINIGWVNGINYHENEISMEVEMQPVIDFSRLEYVFVIEAAHEGEPAAEEG